MVFFLALTTLAAAFFAGWQFRMRQKALSLVRDAESQIYRREQKIKTILDNAPIVFSAVDAKGVFTISEGKGLEKLGRKNNQSVGLNIFEMHNQNPVIIDAVRKSLAGERVATAFELKGISYELYMGPEKNEAGEVTGASMLSVDISERKKIETEKAELEIREKTALETSKLKSAFLATMSHEIRTPINGVLGMTSLLMDTPLLPAQKELAEAIKISGASLLTVINDILDFSKIEAGKLDFEFIDFELPALLRHSAKGPAISAQQKGISFQIDLAEDLPDWVNGDPGRFRQVLNNLLSNAIKFTDKGTVKLVVKPLPFGNAKTIRVEVSDTGIGLGREALSKLFVPFSQAEASMSRRFGGTGLGLSICKNLVEKMGGTIGVESEPGKGSTFWFELGFREGRRPTAEKKPQDLQEVTAGPEQENAPLVLVAEDNEINQLITKRMLEKMGCRTEVVSDGHQALKALSLKDYALVLMDGQMPLLDGLEATRAFRASGPSRNQGTPIIAMTANAMKGDREKCLAAGMDDYVTKPISFEDLKTVVMRWLEIRRGREAKRGL